ncbi:MAG TPA: hypothetical protein VFB60_13845 [Ktedonobacteraceae bacterium]|nr:hypothetical protein [Ktedonobacteraceae bacterium]
MGRKVSPSLFLFSNLLFRPPMPLSRLAALRRSAVSCVLLAIILGIGLAACGSNQGSGGTVTGTTPTATTGSTSTTPSTTGQNCGSINLSPRGTLEDAGLSTKAADCFIKAYQQCQSASLIYRVGGIDTTTVRTFTIEKQGSNCVISDAVQNFVVPHQIGTTKNYTCNGVVISNNQLRISGCGTDGTVIIPTASI